MVRKGKLEFANDDDSAISSDSSLKDEMLELEEQALRQK
jgi:hypothetical protein